MSVPVSRPAPTQDASFSSRGGRDKVTVSPGETTRGARGGLRSAPLVDSWVKTAGAAITAAGAIGHRHICADGHEGQGDYRSQSTISCDKRARFIGRPVRAEGNLVHGSLMKRDRPCEYRFALNETEWDSPCCTRDASFPTRFAMWPTSISSHRRGGIAYRRGLFEASNVLVKCPSKYEMQQRRDRGEALPTGHRRRATQPAESSTTSDEGDLVPALSGSGVLASDSA